MATNTNEHGAGRRKAEPSAVRNIDQLAALLGLPAWDDVDELNQSHYWEVAEALRKDLDVTDPADPEGEEALLDAERAERDAVYRQWHGAVLAAAESLLGAHGLEIVACALPKGAPRDALACDFRIVPTSSWFNAADMLSTTINGAGPFYYATTREFIETTDGTARRAVLSHLGWIKEYPAVYGSASAMRLYEGAWS